MDRARKNGMVGNNYVQNLIFKKNRADHIARIKKIKSRKPGSSKTLDNSPPVIVKACLTNPRKAALKDQFNFVTERENRVLLKRISTILTAPPKITDKEYKEMKKLIPTGKGNYRELYEQSLTEKKTREFFENLKRLKPYYKASEWEKEYQVAQFNKKFMREVKYERPPGFVDPFQEPPAEGKDSKAKAKKKESSSDDGDIDEVLASILDDNKGAGATGKATSSAHVNRVRAVRRANKKGSNIQLSKSATTGNTLDSESRNQRNGINSEGNAASMDEDSFFPAMLNSADDGEEDREDLAYIQRTIRVTEENLNASESTDLMSNTSLVSAKGHRIMVYSLNAELQSWLVNGQVMVIFASTTEEFVHLEAEAEISLSDLAVIRGLPADYSFESDRSFLQSIAKEIVNNVELKVEKGVARIVLNLVGESDIDFENEPNEKSNQELLLNSSLSQSHASQEEIERMLLEDRSNLDLKQGSLVPVVFNVSHALQAANSIHNVVELARKAKNVEHLHALIRITTTPDDQLLISMTFLSNSNMMFKKNLSSTRPAVTAGSRITMLAPLPSIVQADPDMIPVYAKNLFPSLRVEHDLKLGTNHITISS